MMQIIEKWSDVKQKADSQIRHQISMNSVHMFQDLMDFTEDLVLEIAALKEQNSLNSKIVPKHYRLSKAIRSMENLLSRSTFENDPKIKNLLKNIISNLDNENNLTL